MSIKILDLFAGAGGFSEGFYLNNCDLVAHIEMDKEACNTLTTRAIFHALKKKNKLNFYKKYLLGEITKNDIIAKFHLEKERDSVIQAEIGKENCALLINEVRSRLAGRKLDIIIGGPPCQAYSNIGRSRDDRGMKGDKRNFLYRYYVDFLIGLKPKVFIFENVLGLKTAGGGKYLRDMRKLMKEAGYDTDYRILNAADYGVPQSRKRLIMIGWDKSSKIKRYPDFQKKDRSYLVKDFLKDLPSIKSNNLLKMMDYKTDSVFLKKLGIREKWLTNVFDHITRPNTKKDLDIYKIALQKHSKGKLLKYNELPKKLVTHQNTKAFLDRFKVVDSNAKAAQTIVAHISKDGHHFIYPDKNQLRSISVREAARLQTFPDSYKFEGSRTAQFHQIGNAVPPMLADQIASVILKEI
ncbi:DNA cytosine methyltransferase [Candidatus Gracilibacteria bacterium]|nr:DNA cytosine methyltransferase [Candidatus Gracilibacteria bacterium]